jgi:hypothetical protein
MTGFGLPVPGVVLRNLIAVDIDVPVGIDVDITAPPVPASPAVVPGSPDRDSSRKADDSSRDDPSGRVIRVVRIWRVRGIPPGTIDHRRIVGRHVYHGGIGRFDDNSLVLDYDLLFFGCL